VIPLVTDILIGIVDLWIIDGRYKQALKLIEFSEDPAGFEKQTRNRAIQLQIEIESHLSKHKIQTIIDQARPMSLQEHVKYMMSNKSD